MDEREGAKAQRFLSESPIGKILIGLFLYQNLYMEHQSMNLNIRYDLPREIWETKVPKIYSSVSGWLGYADDSAGLNRNLPHWFSFDSKEKHINASVEPSGLYFEALMEEPEWEEWKKEIKKVATEILGFKVGEIELGEVDD